ncbi:MAG: M16 family metallopeptidase [Candidatus Krumholzibacteriia bacterium]
MFRTVRLPAALAMLLVAGAALAAPVTPPAPPAGATPFPTTTFTLPNGLTVILQEDHRLPVAVIATRFGVGSKDEAPGRTGFAHLFEHLMFMGTKRVPGNQFDMIMESEGAENNAFTSNDRTGYYSFGPAETLPTLLWLDADRLQALGDNMTQEKVDLQRSVVRNERRQSYENAPYGAAELVLPEMLWPAGHPYYHPVIGAHADLQAATLQDVKDFFATWYVPGNAVTVVAGDFDPAQVRAVVESTFGAVPARQVPQHAVVEPYTMQAEVRRLITDKVEFPKLYLVWHAPAAYADGSAAMDFAARILAGSPSARLDRRLKIDRQLAQDVAAYLDDRELGSLFQIEITAAPGADLEEIKRETLAVLDDLARDGPTAEELSRLQAQYEVGFRQRAESVLGRSLAMTDYYHYFGRADGFAQDLARYTALTPVAVRDAARAVFGPGRADLRVLPVDAAVAGANLDQRPALFAPRPFAAPVVESFKLPNGIAVDFLPRAGSGLFAGTLLAAGGERLLPADKAGLGALTATLLTCGAAGKDATAYAAAVEALGADVSAEAGREDVTVTVNGLASKLEPTLDLFADAILRPTLSDNDFNREKGMLEAGIAARADEPVAVARLAGSALLYGRDDPRGRPVEGYEATVAAITPADVKGAAPRLLDPSRARFVFTGDCTRAQLEAALVKRFGKWQSAGGETALPPSAPPAPAATRVAMVDRPGAPQTVIYLLRAVPPAEGADRATRACINTLFGGSFTSRLMQNLREKHGYTYGARSAFAYDGARTMFVASSSVQTAVTGAALTEFRNEFQKLAAGGVEAPEVAKAVLTTRRNLMESAETVGGLTAAVVDFAANGRPVDSLGRDIDALTVVTPAQVNALAASGLFKWDDLMLVLVGDRATVLPQLKTAGIAEPVTVDAEGRIVRP